MAELSVYFIFNLFLLVMGGYIFIKTTPDLMKKRSYKVFKVFIVVFQVYIIINSLWTMQEYDVIQMPKWLFEINCMLSLMGVLLNTFCFYKFLMIFFGYSYKKNNLYEFFGAVPFLIICILLITSIWTGFVFSVSDSLNIIQGNGYIFLPIIAFTYFIIIY